MEVSVKDSFGLVAASGLLEVTRTFVLRNRAPNTPTDSLRFTVPADAQIGICSHRMTVRPGANQRQVDIQLDPPEDRQDESVTLALSLPTERVGSDWRLSGRFLLIGVEAYELEISLGRPVNPSSWTPGLFLKRASLTPGTGTAVLREDSQGAPFLVDIAVAFRFQEPSYDTEQIDRLLGEMLTLDGLARRRDQVFRSFRVIALLHFLIDLLPFLRALELRGLEPSKTLVLYKDYPYTHRERVRATLEGAGFQTWGPVASAEDPSLLRRVSAFLAEGPEPVIIIEDGGYLAPAFHESIELKPFLGRLRGVVEQTTYGARVAENLLQRMQERGEKPQLGCPLISVARSEAKVLYEPAFVAEAACNNVVIKLAGLSWRDAGVLLIGYGAIGSAVFSTLKQHRARVVVCDSSPLRLLLARRDQAHFVVSSVAAAVTEFRKQKLSIDYVVGTTGRTSVSTDDAIALSSWSPVLVSVSSKRVEFDIDAFQLRAASTSPFSVEDHVVGTQYSFPGGVIKVLGDGYPINFVSSESVPNQHIDPIMALLHVCAAELARPAVLCTKAGFVGDSDADYPRIPKSRLSHEVVQDIIEATNLFDPLLAKLVVTES